MGKTAIEIDKENQEQLLRNPSVDFTGHINLASQTGNKSIPQMIQEFERAGRAIMVAEADANFPETPGIPRLPRPRQKIQPTRKRRTHLLDPHQSHDPHGRNKRRKPHRPRGPGRG